MKKESTRKVSITLKPAGLRSEQEKKLDRIRAIGLKEVPIIPQIKEFCDKKEGK